MEQHDGITQTEYAGFQHAYDFFNRELFAGSLPQVLIVLQRKAKTGGYFAAERFGGRLDASVTHELALNPDLFLGEEDAWILSVLAHEMAHVWQYACGTLPRRAYHDKEWAAKMQAIGLQPSHTGAPGGKETGQKMSHYIVADGAFDVAVTALQATGFQLHWQSAERDATARKPPNSKTKFTCPVCGQNAWGKPTTLLVCVVCLIVHNKPSPLLSEAGLDGFKAHVRDLQERHGKAPWMDPSSPEDTGSNLMRPVLLAE